MERLYKGFRIRIFNFWRCLLVIKTLVGSLWVGVMGQNQDIGNSSLANSEVQQTQTGRDAVSFQNSQDNQVTINNIILRMFGKSGSPQVDWEWGKLILEKKQLPDIRQRLTDTLGRKRISMDVSLQEQLSWVNRTLQIDDQDYGTLDANKLRLM